jgi:MFS family permease
LLPLVVRDEMKLGPSAYGQLLSALGAGALIGAAMLPKFNRMASVDGLITGASGVFAAVTIGSGLVRNRTLMVALMLLGGVAWMIVLSSLNVAARMVVPAWVQARSLAIYLLVFQGGTAMGSLAWGAVASRWGISSTLVAAGVGLIIGAATTFIFPLHRGDSLDLRPAADWPEPNITGELDIEKGPTFVTVEYRIDPLNAEEFVRAMGDMRRIRRRDGAVRWALFVDASDPARFLEEFVVESWLEHLRQHERITVSDRQLQEQIRLLHTAPEAPHVTHYTSAGRSVRPSDALRPALSDPPVGTRE